MSVVFAAAVVPLPLLELLLELEPLVTGPAPVVVVPLVVLGVPPVVEPIVPLLVDPLLALASDPELESDDFESSLLHAVAETTASAVNDESTLRRERESLDGESRAICPSVHCRRSAELLEIRTFVFFCRVFSYSRAAIFR